LISEIVNPRVDSSQGRFVPLTYVTSQKKHSGTLRFKDKSLLKLLRQQKSL
jgi:hypothetical protein